jgi:hypothetical protein
MTEMPATLAPGAPPARRPVPPLPRVRALPLAVCVLATATALIHLWLSALTTVMITTSRSWSPAWAGRPC